MSDLFEAAGGATGLRAMLSTFYDSVFSDVMIGFFFAAADKDRLIQKELELTARALGATGLAYTGKPLQAAHAKHPIMGGHVERRLQLLKDAMAAHEMPAEVVAAVVEHNEALRSMVTDDVGSECDHDAAKARMSRLLGDPDEDNGA